MLRLVYPASGGRIKELTAHRLVDATLVVYPIPERIWGRTADQGSRIWSREPMNLSRAKQVGNNFEVADKQDRPETTV